MKKIILLGITLLLFMLSSKAQTSSTESDFYDINTIQQIKITLKQQNWRAVLDSLRKNGDNYLVGKAEIQGKVYNNIGIKYRGGRSFKMGAKKNPLHIKLNFIDKGQAHQGYKSVKLSNALRDPSMVREVLGFEIARKYMPAPQANYAQISINEEYYGVFVNIEDVGSEFLEKHFGSSDGTFFKCSPDLKSIAEEGCKKNIFAALIYEEDAGCYLNKYELESEAGWDDLIQLTKVLAQSPEKTEDVLNVDRTLWMLAFNNVMVNLSSYSGRQSQNYFLYKDSKGQFNPIIWDLNLSFGSYKSAIVGSDLRLKQLQELDHLLHIDNPYKPLISQLLQIPAYKKTYLSHLRTILYENFVNDSYIKRAETLQRLVQVPFINDQNRYYDYEDFKKGLTSTVGRKSRIPGISELMERRTKILKKRTDLRVIPPSISDVKVLKRGQYESQLIDDFTVQATVSKLPQKVRLFYRYSGEEAFREAEMFDNGAHNDEAAKDGIYGATVSRGPNDYIEYYIVAENKASISFEPAQYMHRLYEARIAELN